MKIDLGCGSRKKEGMFGIDCQGFGCVDLVCNCNEIIPLDSNCASEIHANDFLEHINNDKRIHIMNEIWRLLKSGGIFYSFTPSTDGRGAFQDPTHFSFWNQNSFYYYTDDQHRLLYNIKCKFDLLECFTTEKNDIGVCWVIAKLKAIK
jgi:predicted SAM-dependent methyltransferase